MDKLAPPAGGFRSVVWLAASLIAGCSYWFARDAELAFPVMIAWKGSCVGLLAIHALTMPRSASSLALAAIMALGSLGDMLIEISLAAGALAFLVGHLVAIRFYWLNRTPDRPALRRLFGPAIVVVLPLVAFFLPADRSAAPAVAVYSAGLAGMLAAALASRFPLGRVGLGAALFALSDLLIFARMGPLASSPIPGLLIWPLYFFGQFLICIGIIGRAGILPPAVPRA